MKRFLAQLTRPIGKALAPLWHALRASWKAAPLRLLQFLGRAFARVFGSVVGWCARLNWRLLLQALPAFAAAITGGVVLAFAAFTSAQDVDMRYLDRAQSATKAKDYAEALVCYERLASVQNDRPDVLYELAVTAEIAGQPGRCSQLMRQLAPPDRQGYPQAHLWQAVRLMVAPQQTYQGRQLAETHLLRALEGGVPDKEAAHGLLGDIYLNKGLYNQAEEHLLIAVKTKPQVRLRLAHLYALQGNLDRARTEAKLAANMFSNVAKADHYARLRWAEATTFLEDFPQAIAILQEGLSGSGELFYRTALAQTYATWVDTLSRQDGSNVGKRLELIELGLRWDPRNLALLDRLLMAAGIKHDPRATIRLAVGTVGLAATSSPWCLFGPWSGGERADADAAAATLRRVLAEGGATGQVHFAIGMDAWQRQDFKAARFHFERALQLSPEMPTIANNLAWLLLQTSPGELPRALDLINLAIEKAPREVNFRDTRGHILAKMGKYREAVEDLEAVLPFSPNVPEVHRSLAGIYTRLELPVIAAEHERLAGEKSAKKTPNKH